MAVFKYDRFLSFAEITQALREAGAIEQTEQVTSFAQVETICSKKLGKIMHVTGFMDASMAIREAFGAGVVGVDDPDCAHGDKHIQSGTALA